MTLHYGLGVLPGAAYAKLRKSLPAIRAGRGAVYGAALFLVNDLVMSRLLGVASSPRRYPWQAHARGLVAHMTLGVATEAVLSQIDKTRVEGDIVG